MDWMGKLRFAGEAIMLAAAVTRHPSVKMPHWGVVRAYLHGTCPID